MVTETRYVRQRRPLEDMTSRLGPRRGQGAANPPWEHAQRVRPQLTAVNDERRESWGWRTLVLSRDCKTDPNQAAAGVGGGGLDPRQEPRLPPRSASFLAPELPIRRSRTARLAPLLVEHWPLVLAPGTVRVTPERSPNPRDMGAQNKPKTVAPGRYQACPAKQTHRHRLPKQRTQSATLATLW